MSIKENENVAGFNVNLRTPSEDSLDGGFNEYGVRENYNGDELESIDVIYNAMEPGVWKGVEITPEFLEEISSGSVSGIPVQYDHSQSQRANVGTLTKSRFSGDHLKLMFNVPNTGNSLRSDTIADFTHSTGPQITNGSVGFNPRSLEFEKSDKEEAKAKFVDAELIEFSLTPFPSGYDNGGITANFSQAVDSFVGSTREGESQLEVYKSQLR